MKDNPEAAKRSKRQSSARLSDFDDVLAPSVTSKLSLLFLKTVTIKKIKAMLKFS